MQTVQYGVLGNRSGAKIGGPEDIYSPNYAGPTIPNPNAPPMAVPGAPGMVPQFGASPQSQDLANISYILNPQFDNTETVNRAAEQNVGQGVSGSGFGSGTTARLLESEKLARFKLGHELLQPYLEREQSAANLATTNAARLNEIAAQGAQAMAQLQLSEAGQSARLSQEAAARLQQIALAGQQAMAELKLREAGETSRLNSQLGTQRDIARLNLGGDILKLMLSGGGSRPSGGAGAPPYVQGNNAFDWASQTHYTTPPQRYTPPSGSGGYGFGGFSSSIDNILRRYGVVS